MNFITLKELKKMVPVASEFKRVPGLKKILEDGIEVILRKQMENHAEVVVYKNGYVSYHAHERYTVFALHNCTHYYYESQGNEHQTIPHNHFEDMEWHIRLVLEGEDRLVRNLEARESETFSYAADVNPEYNNEMEDPRINVMDFVLNKEFLRKASEEEVQTKVDEQDALKKEMIRVIQGTSGLDREMIQQMVNENKEALLTAQTNLADSEKKLKEIEEQNQKAERNCSDLFTWASTYKGASFERRQAILKQFIKEVRVGRDYNIEIVLNVPLDEFEEFKRHAASAGRGKNQKNKSQNPQKVGRCTSNAGIVVLDKTAGETISIVPKNAAHAILRC